MTDPYTEATYQVPALIDVAEHWASGQVMQLQSQSGGPDVLVHILGAERNNGAHGGDCRYLVLRTQRADGGAPAYPTFVADVARNEMRMLV